MITRASTTRSNSITDLTEIELIHQFDDLARLTRSELSKLARPGGARIITIKSLRYKYVSDQVFLGFIEIDTRRLPHGITHQKLVHPEILKHLTMVLGCSVVKINSTGLTYQVALMDKRPSPTAALPRQVLLNPAEIPAGDYMVPFGISPEGAVWRPLSEVVGILVGGNPRMGKSTYLNAVILSLLLNVRSFFSTKTRLMLLQTSLATLKRSKGQKEADFRHHVS